MRRDRPRAHRRAGRPALVAHAAAVDCWSAAHQRGNDGDRAAVSNVDRCAAIPWDMLGVDEDREVAVRLTLAVEQASAVIRLGLRELLDDVR